MGDYDDTLPYRNLLKEEFSRIMLPTYKEKQGGDGSPLGKAEAKRQMKMLYTKVLKKFSEKTQFIVVTHNKLTMEKADYLYGVTQKEEGVSQIVSVKLAADAVK